MKYININERELKMTTSYKSNYINGNTPVGRWERYE